MSEVATTLTVEQPREVADRYYPNGKLGGLVVDGRPPGPLGARVLLTVHVKKREFIVRGQLAWVRHQTSRQPPSYGVDFLPEDDVTRVRLMAFARDEVTADSVRVEKRLQVELPVRIVHDGRARKEFLADLSSTGAFVRTWNPIATGEQVELSVRESAGFFGSTLALQGTVVWARVTGEAPGMGIEFALESTAQEKLGRLLLKLSRGQK